MLFQLFITYNYIILGLLAKNIFGKTESQLCIWNGRTCETGQTVLAHMCDVLKAEGILPDDKEALENILKALDSMVTKRSNIEVDAEVLCVNDHIWYTVLYFCIRKAQCMIYFLSSLNSKSLG